MKIAVSTFVFGLVVAAAACTGKISDGQAVAVAPSSLARLTAVEYQRTVTAIFGDELVAGVQFETLPADGVVGQFATNAGLNVNADSADRYRIVAEQIGARAGERASALLGCDESEACVDAFIRSYGELIYRRPLSDDEVGVFRNFWTTARSQGSVNDAMRLIVTAFLQTPDFLYRLEQVPGGTLAKLNGYELASRLAFFLWKSGPDRELLTAASNHDLDTRGGLAAQARRLLDDKRADFTLLHFFTAWLGIAVLDRQDVNPVEFPEYAGLRDDMIAETQAFILHVFRNDDAQLRTLFSANYSFASPKLATFYGAGVVKTEGNRITLDPSQRMGVLTQASFLTAHARTPTRAAIFRGRSMLIDVLCKPLVFPANGNTAVNFDPTLPGRKQVEQVTSSPGCRECHALFNPMGFLFENYDGIGRWRTTDHGEPVNATAEVIGTEVGGTMTGAPEFLRKLGDSEEVANCMARQWFRFALSRMDEAADEESIVSAATAAHGDMRELIVNIVQSDGFRYRALPTSTPQ